LSEGNIFGKPFFQVFVKIDGDVFGGGIVHLPKGSDDAFGTCLREGTGETDDAFAPLELTLSCLASG
jgi:hypothetical protein